MQPYTFVFFGIVGSGKGTQVKLLQEVLKATDPAREVVYAYPGGEFLKLTQGDTYTGKLVKETFDLGHLQPNFITISLFTNILVNSLTPEKHLIADGYPRTIEQSKAFETAVEFYKRSDIKIIYIELSKEEAAKRMQLRGRVDDTPEGIARRFDEYVNNVVPAMNYFNDKEGYTVYKINGEQTIEKVHEDIKKALGL